MGGGAGIEVTPKVALVEAGAFGGGNEFNADPVGALLLKPDVIPKADVLPSGEGLPKTGADFVDAGG